MLFKVILNEDECKVEVKSEWLENYIHIKRRRKKRYKTSVQLSEMEWQYHIRK